MPNPLPAPAPAERDESSVEMISAWIAENGLHCSINVGMYQNSPNIQEETAWGMLLADVAGHVSDALAKSGFTSNQNDALRMIVESFNREIETATSARKGGFQ